MARTFLLLGALFAGLGVATGAFGAHGLRKYFESHPDLGTIFETACRYQMYHALALIGLALAYAHWPSRTLDWAGYLFVAGILVFSGSLYSLALSGVRGLGAVTPIGGVAFLGGWLLLAIAMIRTE